MSDIRPEIDKLIEELETQGISQDTSPNNVVGLGDLVESTLTKMGITQERYKEFFGLEECGCTKRKKWLNGVLSWTVKK